MRGTSLASPHHQIPLLLLEIDQIFTGIPLRTGYSFKERLDALPTTLGMDPPAGPCRGRRFALFIPKDRVGPIDCYFVFDGSSGAVTCVPFLLGLDSLQINTTPQYR
jgi:hypothetical protein